MKALTLTQPWATLVAIDAKRIETRSWGTSYRGSLAIHAAKGFPKWARETRWEEPFYTALSGQPIIPNWPSGLPRGAVVATCTLCECFKYGNPQFGSLADICEYWLKIPMYPEAAFGDFGDGRWLWVLSDVKKLDTPISAKGALGLWEWTERQELSHE